MTRYRRKLNRYNNSVHEDSCKNGDKAQPENSPTKINLSIRREREASQRRLHREAGSGWLGPRPAHTARRGAPNREPPASLCATILQVQRE